MSCPPRPSTMPWLPEELRVPIRPAPEPERVMNGLQPSELLEVMVPHLLPPEIWKSDGLREAYSVTPASTSSTSLLPMLSGPDRNAFLPPFAFSSTAFPLPAQELSADWMRAVSGAAASALEENCSLLAVRLADSGVQVPGTLGWLAAGFGVARASGATMAAPVPSASAAPTPKIRVLLRR